MVEPDTINVKMGEVQEVDSVGTLYKNIQTSILLFQTALKTNRLDIANME